MATREELVAAVVDRYGCCDREEKTRILDEFVAVTGFHRKHAMRLLRGGRDAILLLQLLAVRIGRRDEGFESSLQGRQALARFPQVAGLG